MICQLTYLPLFAELIRFVSLTALSDACLQLLQTLREIKRSREVNPAVGAMKRERSIK